MSRSADWDPEPHERQWYTHVTTGDRAYLVRRDGVDSVRLDRPRDEIIRRLGNDWKLDREHRPLNLSQLALVAYAADQQLCVAIGQRGKVKDWLNLSDAERGAWLRGEGPVSPKERADLFKAVWSSLESLAR